MSYPYLTTGKTKALTRWTFVGKVMSLLFNMLSRLVINFLPRNKCLLILWLHSPPAVILEPPQNKVYHCFHCFPSICHELMGPDAMILVFWMLSLKPNFSLYLVLKFELSWVGRRVACPFSHLWQAVLTSWDTLSCWTQTQPLNPQHAV